MKLRWAASAALQCGKTRACNPCPSYYGAFLPHLSNIRCHTMERKISLLIGSAGLCRATMNSLFLDVICGFTMALIGLIILIVYWPHWNRTMIKCDLQQRDLQPHVNLYLDAGMCAYFSHGGCSNDSKAGRGTAEKRSVGLVLHVRNSEGEQKGEKILEILLHISRSFLWSIFSSL